ncbi:MAG: metalloregulator ArsR/SmtB family transcription factor [Chloroflexi bacterium]|nr:metalloregulator ArsR/SmtB family transcription factor [Chloroflexota bacterium]
MEKFTIYERQAEVAKAIAHPLRMAILDYLKAGPQCVCDIAEAVNSERSNVSRHLSIMVSAGVLESHKQGLQVIYKIRTPCVLKCVACLTECLKENAKEEQKILKMM